VLLAFPLALAALAALAAPAARADDAMQALPADSSLCSGAPAQAL
jgi:hypothetical protein